MSLFVKQNAEKKKKKKKKKKFTSQIPEPVLYHDTLALKTI